MNEIGIPLSLGQDKGGIEESYREAFSNRRTEFLGELRQVPGIVQTARTLIPEATYRIAFKPTGAEMFKDSQGMIQAVWYRDGKIVQHVKLQQVGPSLFKMASAIGTQVLLFSIVAQLNRVEEALEFLRQGLRDDRLGKIEAGIDQLRQALSMQQRENRAACLHSAAQTLNEGIKQSMRALKAEIADAPEPTHSFWDDWNPLRSKADEARRRMGAANETLFFTVKGIIALARVHAELGEPGAAHDALARYFGELWACDLGAGLAKARLVPIGQGSQLPEEPWRKMLEEKPSIIGSIQGLSAIADAQQILVEVRPEDLLEAEK